MTFISLPLSPSCESDSRPAIQILQGPFLCLLESATKPYTYLSSYFGLNRHTYIFLRSELIMSSYPRLGFRNYLLILGFLYKQLYAFLIGFTRATRFAYVTTLDFLTIIVFDE